MSLSINQLLQTLASGEKNVTQAEGQLFNPDIPNPDKDFDERIEIRDKAFSALKLPSQPRNGNYFRLGRNAPHIDPRRDEFQMENAIDPNIIRKRVDPDSAIPDLRSGESTLFSLVPNNLDAFNSVPMIQKARQSYVNYKNRFEMQGTPPSVNLPQAGVTKRSMTIKPRSRGPEYLPTETSPYAVPTSKKQTTPTSETSEKVPETARPTPIRPPGYHRKDPYAPGPLP